MQRIRLITPADSVPLAELVTRDRAHLAPWDPARTEDWFTPAGQLAAIEAGLASHQRGDGVPFVILDDEGEVAGRVTLTSIVRGPLQSCVLGYFLSSDRTGRGYATHATEEAVAHAFGELGLHRVEAGTMLANVASQKVLERAGFVRFGLAPKYLHIAGAWQDHILFQRLNEGWRASRP